MWTSEKLTSDEKFLGLDYGGGRKPAESGMTVVDKPTGATRSLRLLVVEDDPVLLLLLKEHLASESRTVDTAAGGHEAVEKLSTSFYDLVLADLHLPGLDGLTLLEWIGKSRPQTKVVIMTGDDTPSHIIAAIRNGAADYLLKPFGLLEATEVVDRCCGAIQLSRQEALTSLIKQIMHDVRGDLVTLAIMVKLLHRGRNGSLGPGVKEKVGEIDAKLRAMTGMVEDYFSLALIVGQGSIVSEEELDLKKDVIEKILEELAVELSRKSIIVVDNLDLSSLRGTVVRGNRVLLLSVFRTLFRNAVRHCLEDGTISYGISCNGRRFMVQVANEGPVVPEHLRESIFEEFVKGSSSMNNREEEGLGMGLTLARDIIRQHGGEIWYEAEPQGSKFVMTLPAST
jgi:K+-sensing histidine kinase KdpD